MSQEKSKDRLPPIPPGYRWRVKGDNHGWGYIYVILEKLEIRTRTRGWINRGAATEELWTKVSDRSISGYNHVTLPGLVYKAGENILRDLEDEKKLTIVKEEVLGIYEPRKIQAVS